MASAADEVTALVYTYAERIDAGDFDGVADLFARGEIALGEGGPVRRGRDEVRAMYEASTRRYGEGTPRTKHVTTNLIVDVDRSGSAATVRSYFTVLQAVPGLLALQPVIAGRYHDRFDRVDGEWGFTHRRINVDLVGDLTHHLLFDLPDGG